MTNLNKPIRTCIACRERIEQNKLIRLQCIDKNLASFNNSGRSFYLCDDCLNNQKKCEKALYRQCRNKDNYFEQLKEIVKNGR